MLQNEVNALRDTPVATPTMIIGGQSVAAHSGQTLEVSSPVDGQTLTHIPNAGEHDVAAAVAAARTSFDAGVWARIAPAGRKKILLRWAELIELNALELAVLGVRDNGTEMSMAFKAVLRMVALAHEAGLPEGVLNVITGEGPVSGRALARSMDVDALVFTGSVNVGRRLMEYAAQSNLKRVFLELGGKSPHIVFDDTQDIDTAAQAVVNGIFRNSGQVCIAGSRLLVQDTIHDALVDKIITLSEGLRVGDPLDLSNQIGAVSSEEHLQRILTMLKGNDSIATGGARLLADTGGSYMQPTVVLDQQPDDPLVRNEIFGPVLTVTRFKKETDAVEMANASELGLAAGVWTNELGRAHRMISALRAGVVHVNTFGGADNTVPLGGFKQSGNGHDKSLHAIEKFINKKTAWIKL